MVKKKRLTLWNEITRGFTLVEVLIVIAITAIVAIASVGSFTNSLKGSRDGKRKADLSSIQKALESSYNDNGFYPVDTGSGSLCASTVNCYLKTTPSDPKGYTYLYLRGSVSGTNQSFQLYSTLERNIDADAGNDDTGTGTGTYGGNCGVAGGGCKYGVSSTNTTP